MEEKSKLLWASDIFNRIDPSAAGGFNQFVMGDGPPDTSYSDFAPRFCGYDKGREMAAEGKLYYTNIFKCKCGGHPFMYGGFFVCNSCGGKGVDEPWWIIKTYKDGDEWCCVGLDFEDLQSSDNYAFGKTRGESIANYEKLYQ